MLTRYRHLTERCAAMLRTESAPSCGQPAKRKSGEALGEHEGDVRDERLFGAAGGAACRGILQPGDTAGRRNHRRCMHVLLSTRSERWKHRKEMEVRWDRNTLDSYAEYLGDCSMMARFAGRVAGKRG